MERCVCAPQREPGGMESEPIESLSIRVGREAMAAEASSLESSFDGLVERTPGVNVFGANTCFISDEQERLAGWQAPLDDLTRWRM